MIGTIASALITSEKGFLTPRYHGGWGAAPRHSGGRRAASGRRGGGWYSSTKTIAAKKPPSSSRAARQLRGHALERGIGVGADRLNGGQAHDDNQRQHDGIFHRGRAIFRDQETLHLQ